MVLLKERHQHQCVVMVVTLMGWSAYCHGGLVAASTHFTPDRTEGRGEDDGGSKVVLLKERHQHQCVVMVVTLLGWSACAIAGLLLWRARPVAMVAALLPRQERCYDGRPDAKASKRVATKRIS